MKRERRPGAAQQIRKWTVLALLFVGLAVLGYALDRLQPVGGLPENTAVSPAPSAERARIRVKIEGSVPKPGEYTMREGDRLKDLVDKAGGLPEGYEVGQLPVSMFSALFDGQLVVIP